MKKVLPILLAVICVARAALATEPVQLLPNGIAGAALGAIISAFDAMKATDTGNSETVGATGNTWIGFMPQIDCDAGHSFANLAVTNDSATSAVPCIPLGPPLDNTPGNGIGLQYLTGQTLAQCAYRVGDSTYNMATTGLPAVIKGNTSTFTASNGKVEGGICSQSSGHTFVGTNGSFHGQTIIEIGHSNKLSYLQCQWLLAQCTNLTYCSCS